MTCRLAHPLVVLALTWLRRLDGSEHAQTEMMAMDGEGRMYCRWIKWPMWDDDMVGKATIESGASTRNSSCLYHNMERLPPELIRKIIREATLQPALLDYPCELETNLADDERALRTLVAQSMPIKCTLSLVSKTWHNIGLEFLYETILVRRVEKLEGLSEFLAAPGADGIKRGWWCRRLVVAIFHWSIPWTSGRTDLWGLLPACPRLLSFHLHIKHINPPKRRSPRIQRFYRPSIALFHQILTLYGPSLRVLNFGRFLPIQVEIVVRLLPHLPVLEVCRIKNLVAPWPPSSDDEESDNSSASRSANSEHEWTYDKRLNEKEWPSSMTVTRVRLPRLEVLECCTIIGQVVDWQLPALTQLSLGIDHGWSADKHLFLLKEALLPHLTHILRFSHAGGQRLDAWMILDLFPSLVDFSMYPKDFTCLTSPSQPHQALKNLIVYRNPLDENPVSQTLDSVMRALDHNLLPVLRDLRFEGFKVGDEKIRERKGDFAALGVVVSF